MESSERIRLVASSQGGSGGTSPAPPSKPDVTLLFEALRDAAESQDRAEDQLLSKTRNIVAVAAGYFTIVQTVVFSAGALGPLDGNGKTWTVALAIGALVGLATATAWAIVQQWPKQRSALPRKKIGQDLSELLFADVPPEDADLKYREAVFELARYYAGVAKSRSKVNKDRQDRYYWAAVFSLVAIAATSCEFIVSLMVR